MPPTRRKSSAPSSHAQQTLAFSGRSNKVTKPSIAHPSPKSLSKTSPSQLSKASKAVSEVSSPETVAAHADSQPQEPEEVVIPDAEQGLAFRVQGAKPNLHDEVSEKARKVSDAQVKRYWRGKEEERKAPRGESAVHFLSNDLVVSLALGRANGMRVVHQQGLSLNEKILRHFDLSSQYGPCIGVARMKRWKRANGLGLRPPIEVLTVLLKEEGSENKKAERAYVDELMSTRLVVE